MDKSRFAHFLFTMNEDPSHRVGFLRRSEAGILNQLAAVNDDHMLIIEEDNEIIAAIALILDKQHAKVIGPITSRTDETTLNQLQQLWLTFVTAHPGIKTYEFYIGADHLFGQEVMKSLKTQYLGTLYTMAATQADTTHIDTRQVIPYSELYKKSFMSLLKNLYLHPKEQAEKLLNPNDKHELFILVNEGLVKGYIWLSVHPHATCYIDYVATHKDYRQQGIGHQLVAYATNYAFTQQHANEVQLRVEDKRKRTIEFYEKIGFHKISELHHFKYDVRQIKE